MLAGLHSYDRMLDTGQQLLGLKQRQSQLRSVAKVAGTDYFQHVTLRALLSVRISTNCNTKASHDLPAGSGPAGHIAPVSVPQSLDTPTC